MNYYLLEIILTNVKIELILITFIMWSKFLNLNLDIYDSMIQNLTFYQIITMLSSNKDTYKLWNDELFWSILALHYKGKFFWELANMRTEQKNYMICDRSISLKQDLITIYKYDTALLKDNQNIYEQYYYGWIYIEHQINVSNSIKMMNKFNEKYKLYHTQITKYNSGIFHCIQRHNFI